MSNTGNKKALSERNRAIIDLQKSFVKRLRTDISLISKDAQRALEVFSEDFTAALVQGGVDQWATTHGKYFTSKALKTTYPVPVSAAGYKKFEGDIKYRSLYQKSLELIPKTWQDGVSELASVIEAPDFVGWTSEPDAMAAGAMTLLNSIVAERLHANPKCWDEQLFFSKQHPVNVFSTREGVYSNDFTGPGTHPSHGNLKLAKQRFRDIKAPNGKPLGLRMTHVMVPPSQEELWRDMLENDLLIETVIDAGGRSYGAINNRHKGTVGLIVADELEDPDEWYPLALGKPGMFPWVCQDQGAPEEILSDKSSNLYQTSLRIGVAYILRGNAELAMPHCVQRWAGEDPAK